jgi:predicted acylesterase/phospholipase RssA
MRSRGRVMLLVLLFLAGCTTVPRAPAPARLIDAAAPDGFPADIRLLTIDRQGFRKSPRLLRHIRAAADGGSLDVLALSGGGSGGAFGAGALIGLSRAHARPQFELVTGVSAGALIAPFAFLGPDWDDALAAAFSGVRGGALQRSPRRQFLARLLFPRGPGGRSPLADLVDHSITDAMIDAVAVEWRKGRRLIVATTDLDKQETVLWDMGAIAAHGGEAARRLFRTVLVASASVPGVFPPVLIPVRDGTRRYAEMHVDGGVTTPLFTAPLIAQILPDEQLQLLRGANLYVIVNGQLAITPTTTPYNTLDVLARSFTAELTYKTREALVLTLAFTRKRDMQFHLTAIPVDYPFRSFVDFEPSHMRALFDFGAGCAARGLLWVSAEQSLRRNVDPRRSDAPGTTACPLPSVGRSDGD